jgi:hypothetical protein
MMPIVNVSEEESDAPNLLGLSSERRALGVLLDAIAKLEQKW